MSEFEQNYLKRMNRIARTFFALHLPLFLLISWVNDTGPLLTLGLTSAVLLVPWLSERAFDSERSKSLALGFTAMCMGGILVHIGQGPVQIEMHFYFFSVLAMLALFANPMAVIAAAATVSVHHLLLWYIAPDSVFNYDAPLWVVLVHAAFVVLETVAACFIARNFFDCVIGLEKKVAERTVEVNKRNEDMRIVLDNVQQGLVTVSREGLLHAEHSRAFEDWFGAYTESESLFDYLGRGNKDFASWLQLSWDGLLDGFLPIELVLDQLPKQACFGDHHFSFDYQPILDEDGEVSAMMIVVSDITAEIAQQEAEVRQRETFALFERALADRSGLSDFLEEGDRLVAASKLTGGEDAAVKRSIHTLKGNAGLFGLKSISQICHELEDHLAEDDQGKAEEAYEQLVEQWSSVQETTQKMLGHKEVDDVSISREDFQALFSQVVDGGEHSEIARHLVELTLEPAGLRLERFAEQARALAERLEKGVIDVLVQDNGIRLNRERLQPFWNSLVHVLRNAVDHGIEPQDVRAEIGKSDVGHLALRAFDDGDDVVIEVEDDGRGIDWERVRSKAEEQGLPADTKDDLIRVLLEPGFTTCDDVTDMSGRGVGLSAASEACRELGGSVSAVSDEGCGTTIQFRIPASIAKNNEKLAAA